MSEMKIFQCNYAAGRPPEVFLGVAVTAGLTQMHGTATGLPTWRMEGRPVHIGPLEGSLAIAAVSQYVGLAGISGTVAAHCRLLCELRYCLRKHRCPQALLASAEL